MSQESANDANTRVLANNTGDPNPPPSIETATVNQTNEGTNVHVEPIPPVVPSPRMTTRSVTAAHSDPTSTMATPTGVVIAPVTVTEEPEIPLPELLDNPDVFAVDLAEYMEEIRELEADVDRSELADGTLSASGVTKNHVIRRQRVEDSFLNTLSAVSEYLTRMKIGS